MYWSFAAARRCPSKHRVTRAFTVLNTGLLYLGLVLIWLGRSVPSLLGRLVIPQAIAIDILGTVFTILGVAFAIWSRRLLSHNWSGEVVIVQGQQFIRTGPYALVRHPIYTGILLALLGTMLVAATVGSLLGFVLAIISFRQKARVEEKLLVVEFGEQYTNYQREVKSLIPFIY